jgi:hypothetical protein
MNNGDVVDRVNILVEQREKLIINFHCGDKCASFCKRKSERTEASTDLKNMTVVVDVCEARNLSHRVGINNKVLSEGTLCTKTRAL